MVNMGFLKNVTWDGEGECYSEGGVWLLLGGGKWVIGARFIFGNFSSKNIKSEIPSHTS